MARVFLSYAGEDVETARHLAQAIGARGYDVWWDRHLHGGSRFAAEADRALENSEVVVVGSEMSVESARVQDQAAEEQFEVDPDLDPIRSDPRSKEMLASTKARLGMPEATANA